MWLGGGGRMREEKDPPPPPLAADAIQSSLQANLATQNICVATSHLLECIRTLRYSALVMDIPTIQQEEQDTCQQYQYQQQQLSTNNTNHNHISTTSHYFNLLNQSNEKQ